MGINLYFDMKFLVLILSLLAVMQATQIQEETELGWSAYCKRRVHKFAKNWWKIDRNRDGKIYWREMRSWAVRKGHGKYLKHYYKFWKRGPTERDTSQPNTCG